MQTGKIVESIQNTLDSKDVNFTQKIDLIINLKDLDQDLEFFVVLPYKNKTRRICAITQNTDTPIDTIDISDLPSDKKKLRTIAKKYDLFIAQTRVMPTLAKNFGSVLGPQGKMPNPKAGCVITPKTDIITLCQRLQRTVPINTKDSLVIHTTMGNEDVGAQKISENVCTLYNQLIHHLPKERNNIESIFLKSTMGTPVRLL